MEVSGAWLTVRVNHPFFSSSFTRTPKSVQFSNQKSHIMSLLHLLWNSNHVFRFYLFLRHFLEAKESGRCNQCFCSALCDLKKKKKQITGFYYGLDLLILTVFSEGALSVCPRNPQSSNNLLLYINIIMSSFFWPLRFQTTSCCVLVSSQLCYSKALLCVFVA